MANDASPGGVAPVLTRLVLIRHGESVGNATQAIHGPRMCGGLSDAGREQCERLAERLARTGELAGAVLYASQFRRAQETAKLIAPALGDPEVVVDGGFGEIDWGVECDGLTFTEIVGRYGTPDWDGDPEVPFLPGGESSADLQRRVIAAVDRVVTQHPGRIVVVCTHGGAIDVAVRYALGVEGRGQFDLYTTNTSLTTVTHTSWGRWRIERYNDAAHLQ
jgi:probable phosphoglycerate mutase